jgi:predicted SnoaL-like aldol condensation-catalyzing enzyme
MAIDASETVAAVIGMWNGAAKDRLDDRLAPGYRGHMLGVPGGERDAAGYVEAIDRFRAAYPGVEIRIVEQFAAGDRIVSRLEARRPNPDTMTAATSQGMNISRFDAQGRLAEEWAIWTAWLDVAASRVRTATRDGA